MEEDIVGKYLDSCCALIGVLNRAKIERSILSKDRIDCLMWNCKTIQDFAEKAHIAGEIDIERKTYLDIQAITYMNKLKAKRGDLDE